MSDEVKALIEAAFDRRHELGFFSVVSYDDNGLPRKQVGPVENRGHFRPGRGLRKSELDEMANVEPGPEHTPGSGKSPRIGWPFAAVFVYSKPALIEAHLEWWERGRRRDDSGEAFQPDDGLGTGSTPEARAKVAENFITKSYTRDPLLPPASPYFRTSEQPVEFMVSVDTPTNGSLAGLEWMVTGTATWSKGAPLECFRMRRVRFPGYSEKHVMHRRMPSGQISSGHGSPYAGFLRDIDTKRPEADVFRADEEKDGEADWKPGRWANH